MENDRTDRQDALAGQANGMPFEPAPRAQRRGAAEGATSDAMASEARKRHSRLRAAADIAR